MATTQANSDGSAKPVPFSYAQAAKGLTSMPSSKVSSGSRTPVKDTAALPALLSELPAGTRWADDEDGPKEKDSNSSATTAVDVQSSPGIRSPINQASEYKLIGITSPPSPDFGASSTSTLAREDDTSSAPISASESAWENKSQSSTIAEKSFDPSENYSSPGRFRNNNSKKGEKGDKGNDKDKDKETEKVWPVHLQEAPVPVVNFWAKRAADQMAKLPVKSVQPTQTAATGASAAFANPRSTNCAAIVIGAASTTAHEDSRVPAGDRGTDRWTGRNHADDKTSQRREIRGGSKVADKTERPVKSVAPPPTQDPSFWPTPDIVKDVDRPEEKVERTEKERNGNGQVSTPAPKTRKAWATLPFTPTVVFNTPLPLSGARRGGRGTARGGREGGGRGAAQPSTANEENGATAQPQISNGETFRTNGRDPVPRNSSPNKGKRTLSNEASLRRDLRLANGNKDAPKDLNTNFAHSSIPVAERELKQFSNAGHITLPRQNNSSRPKQIRRGEISFVNGEKRREGELSTKQNDNAPIYRRTSVSVQDDGEGSRRCTTLPAQLMRAAESGDRRANAFDTGNSHKYPSAGTSRGVGSSSFHNADRSSRGGQFKRGSDSRNGPAFYHNGSNGYTNSYVPGLHPYAVSRSPTGHHQEQFYGQQPRGGLYNRGPSQRTMSIPTEDSYRGPVEGYPSIRQPSMNTFVSGSGMFEYPSVGPVSAIPNAAHYADTNSLLGMVSKQVEYYFSLDNLIKDIWFRKHMDGQGFVLFSVVAEFKRLKALTSDPELLKYACQQSCNIEHLLGSDGLDRLRLRSGWEKWVWHPEADRHPSAQNAGSSQTTLPPPAQPVAWDPYTMRQTSLPLPNSPLSVPNAFPHRSLNDSIRTSQPESGSETMDTAQTPGLQASPRSAPQEPDVVIHATSSVPLFVPGAMPKASTADMHELDIFSNSEVEKLNVVIRQKDTTISAMSTPQCPLRAFSNGSHDDRNPEKNICGHGQGPTSVSPHGPSAPQDSETCGPLASKEVSPPLRGRLNLSRSSETMNLPNSSTDVFWLKEKWSPANKLPANSSSELYTTLRKRAMEQRAYYVSPNSPCDMDVLYQFWSHFLIRNFNYRMYCEFRDLACEDFEQAASGGRDNLLLYFSGALAHQEPIRKIVAHDYVWLVMSEPRDLDRPAYMQLRTAWRNGALNMKSRKRIMDVINPELRAELDDKA